MKSVVIILTVVLFGINGAMCQGTISGKITDNEGVVLPGAHILLSGNPIGVTSNTNGEFSFGKLAAGTYTLTASFVGFELYNEEIIHGGDQTIEIKLSPKLLLGDEIIIKGYRAGQKDPISYTQIDDQELGKTNRIQDIPYLISMTPSVIASSDAGTGVGYTGLRIRGTDPSRINVTINGIPYNDSESHDVYWVNIPDIVSSVESIQIQRGVGTSTNGAGAFGANLNVQTNALNNQPYTEIQSAVGSFSTYKAAVKAGTGLIYDHLSVDMRLSKTHTDGYIDRAFANLSSWYVSAGWYDKRNTVKAIAFSGSEVTYQAWGGVPSELLMTNRTYNPYTYDNEVDDYQQDHYQLHWSHEFNQRWNSTIAGHFSHGEGFYEQYREEETLEDYGLSPVFIGQDTITSSNLIRRKWLDNDFYGAVFSLNYTSNSLNLTTGGGLNKYLGQHFGRVIWSQYASDGDIRHEWYRSLGDKLDANVFIKAAYTILNRINLFGDLQYRQIIYSIDGIDDDLRNISQTHQYHFFNPKAGWSYQIADQTKQYFSISMANREPKRSNFTDAAEDQEILPERLIDYELGFEHRFPRLKVATNLYYMDYKDQLVFTGQINDVGAAVMMNVPNSYRAGMELMIQWQILKTLSWDANVTISRNKVKDFTEYVDDWNTWSQRSEYLGDTDLALSPSVMFNNRIQWNALPSLSMYWDAKFIGRQFIDNTSSLDRSIDPYLINNLNIGYHISFKDFADFRLFLEFDNIFNELYESNAWVYSYFFDGERGKIDGYYPQAGRHFLIGLSMRF